MDKPAELYVEGFNEWLNEQNIHTKELEASIEAAEKIKLSNEKQLSLHKERINIYIQEFNVWAEANGVEPIKSV